MNCAIGAECACDKCVHSIPMDSFIEYIRKHGRCGVPIPTLYYEVYYEYRFKRIPITH